jgi:hypothetical protein
VVWNMTESSRAEMETKVQFWIDLIQVRAPGSKIIIVATRADDCLATKDANIAALMEQLDTNEGLRVSDIRADLRQLEKQLGTLGGSTHAYRELYLKMARLRKSLNMRPHIVTCAPVCAQTTKEGFVQTGYVMKCLQAM